MRPFAPLAAAVPALRANVLFTSLLIAPFCLLATALAPAPRPAPPAATPARGARSLERTVRLRFEWTADKPEVWAGILELSQGTVLKPVSLGTEADEAGTLWPDGKNLWLQRHSPSANDGFETTVIAPSSATLSFTLQVAQPGGSRRRFEWSLADLEAKRNVLTTVKDGPVTLCVRRAPGDALQIQIDRPHLIYHPAEQFEATLVPSSPPRHVSAAQTLEWAILASRPGQLVRKGSLAVRNGETTHGGRLPVAILLPNAEGPCDIRFRLVGGDSAVVEESVVQVLVLADATRAQRKSRPGDAPLDDRLIGPYLSTPLLAETFQAPRTFDRTEGRALDDWQTFYRAALRAVADLKSNGDNSLMLAVFADGSTIYPSRLLEPTPRYNTGAFFSNGQDPLRKDVLELFYRFFDREGLVLVPELRFSTPLPVLERRLATNAVDAEGIELVGSDGRSWREIHGSLRGLAPYYNPLDPRVQTAVLDVVRELVERYGRHPSFRGVALEVDRIGYLQFPGIEWGYDDATCSRFQRESGLAIDCGKGKDRYHRRYEFLSGEARSQWIAWRCRELAKFHRRLAEVVTAAHAEACLVLACKQVLPPNSTDEIRHEIRMRARFGELLPQRGLDFALLAGVPRLVVLRPAIWQSAATAEDRLLDDAVNYSSSFDSAFAAPESGVLSATMPIEHAAHSSSARPWPVERRRRFVRALATNDAHLMFEGGSTIFTTEDEPTRKLRQIVRAIPRIPFYKAPGPAAPEGDDPAAVIRVARRGRKTYLYAANPFAEPAEVVIRLSCPPSKGARPLGPSKAAPMSADGATGSRLAVALEGYGLAAWELDQEDVRVENFHTELPAGALASLKSQIQRFEDRLADARRLVRCEVHVAAGRPADSDDLKRPSESKPRSPERARQVSGAAYWSADRRPSPASEGKLLLAAGAEPERLSPDDLRQLAKVSLELSLAWDENRFAECQRLLDSYWGRYLLLESEKSLARPETREALLPPKPLVR